MKESTDLDFDLRTVYEKMSTDDILKGVLPKGRLIEDYHEQYQVAGFNVKAYDRENGMHGWYMPVEKDVFNVNDQHDENRKKYDRPAKFMPIISQKDACENMSADIRQYFEKRLPYQELNQNEPKLCKPKKQITMRR